MTPLEGDKMKVVVSFVAGLSKDDSSKLDVCLSVSLFANNCVSGDAWCMYFTVYLYFMV